MKYNVTMYEFTDGSLLVDTDFYAETDRDATEYGLTLAQFKGSEEYLLKVRSEDKSFNLMCSGNC